jgi:hypothetical protein
MAQHFPPTVGRMRRLCDTLNVARRIPRRHFMVVALGETAGGRQHSPLGAGIEVTAPTYEPVAKWKAPLIWCNSGRSGEGDPIRRWRRGDVRASSLFSADRNGSLRNRLRCRRRDLKPGAQWGVGLGGTGRRYRPTSGQHAPANQRPHPTRRWLRARPRQPAAARPRHSTRRWLRANASTRRRFVDSARPTSDRTPTPAPATGLRAMAHSSTRRLFCRLDACLVDSAPLCMTWRQQMPAPTTENRRRVRAARHPTVADRARPRRPAAARPTVADRARPRQPPLACRRDPLDADPLHEEAVLLS